MESFWLAIFESPELPRSKMQSTGAAVSGRARSRATRRRKYSARDTPRSLARWRARRCISVSSVICVFAIIMAPSYYVVPQENQHLSDLYLIPLHHRRRSGHRIRGSARGNARGRVLKEELDIRRHCHRHPCYRCTIAGSFLEVVDGSMVSKSGT